MKKIYFFLAAVAVAMSMVACGSKSASERTSTYAAQELQEMIEKMDRECPLELGEFMRVNSFEYADDVVTIHYTVSADVFKMSDVRANKETFSRNLLAGMVNNQNDSFKELTNLMQEANAELRIVFATADGENIEFSYSADEINNALANSDNSSEVLLQAMADNAKLQTPQTMDEGLVMTDVYIKDKCFTYEYTCDENSYDMEVLEQNKQVIKDGIVTTIKADNPIFNQLREKIKECNYRLVYKYIGDTSEKTVVIYIRPDEL